MSSFNLENPNLLNKIYEGENALPRQILVESNRYNFEEKIEDEWVSDFPEYSYRMRSNFVKGVRIIDSLLGEIVSTLNDFRITKESELNSFKSAKERELNSLKSTKEQELNNLMTQLRNEYNNLSSNSEASETKLGLINKNTINTMIDNKIYGRNITRDIRELKTKVADIQIATIDSIWESVVTNG